MIAARDSILPGRHRRAEPMRGRIPDSTPICDICHGRGLRYDSRGWEYRCSCVAKITPNRPIAPYYLMGGR